MDKDWTTIIEPKDKLFDLKLKEVWNYRDLIGLFVQSDIYLCIWQYCGAFY